ncbi:MAG: hypothetical protein L6Q53_12690 [Candidatus Brocadia sinica]|nr:hypothetical protein [Candidatus Brocadia sinica]NUO07015.1 hypothetical protein [Candidatus Brocadia sinica]
MNKDKSPKRIIVDASYIRASRSDGYQLKKLVEEGFQLVLIDNLIFELCSTDNRQWPATQRKLYHVANFIECWRHTSELLEYEENKQCPISTPLNEDFTAQLVSFLTPNQISLPNNFVSHLEYIRKQREQNSVESLLGVCKTLETLSQTLKEQILVHQSRCNTINSICQDLVNNESLIKLLLEWSKIFNPKLVNVQWVAWHHYKSFIAFFCEYLRLNETNDFSKLPTLTQKKWINRKHDLDYVVSLAFADAIATNESKGELSRYVRWMYGSSKKLIYF